MGPGTSTLALSVTWLRGVEDGVVEADMVHVMMMACIRMQEGGYELVGSCAGN